MTNARKHSPMPVGGTVATGIQALYLLAYPLVIYAAHTRLSTRAVGGLLLGLYAFAFLLRSRGRSREIAGLLRQHLPLAVLIGVAIATAERSLLLLLPVLVSGYLCATFAWSLRRGPPMIERFARLVEDDLPPFTLPYCRRVTALWCIFLAANALAVAVLAFAAPIGWWAIYTGFGFYVLLGAVLAAELCFRKWWFRYYGDGLVDRAFAKLFPSDRTAVGRRSLAYAAARERSRPASLRSP